MVKTGHGREVSLWDIWGVGGQDVAVGVCGVCNDEYLCGGFADFVEDFSLSLEDVTVGLEELFTFHSLLTWETTNEKRNVDVSESLAWVACSNKLAYERVSSVINLHDNTLKSRHTWLDVE